MTTDAKEKLTSMRASAIAGQSTEIERLTARIVELEAALKPFADQASKTTENLVSEALKEPRLLPVAHLFVLMWPSLKHADNILNKREA